MDSLTPGSVVVDLSNVTRWSVLQWRGVQSLLWITAMLVLYYLVKGWLRVAVLISRLPGPTALPLVGNLSTFFYHDRLLPNAFKLSKVYPGLYRLWFGMHPVVIVHSPDFLQEILGNSKYVEKGYLYKPLRQIYGTGLVTSSGLKWHRNRKLITPTFHFNILENYIGVFARRTELLVKRLQAKVGAEAFDICPFVSHCTMEIFYEAAGGVLKDKEEIFSNEVFQAFYSAEEIVMRRVLNPWLLIDWFFKFTPTGKTQLKCKATIQNFAKKVIQDKKETLRNQKSSMMAGNEDSTQIKGKKKTEVFIDLLLKVSQDGALLTEDDTVEELITFMNGGQATSASAICFSLFLLGKHPEIQDRVYDELMNIFGDSDRGATMQDMSEMRYLEMCIKEGLRLYPAIPLIARRMTRDVNLGKHTLPAGCDVGVVFELIHKNPEYFSNPEEFNPDHFLPENIKQQHPYAFIPFSAGPRNCIGQKFAYLMEKAVLSTLLRRYRFEALDRPEDLVLLPNIVLHSKHGLKFKIHPRT